MARRLIGFPNPVNEKAARTVAAGVAIITATALVAQWWWLSALLALGFLARVLTGPKLSPLGQLATRVVAPRLGAPKEVPGPPKRFAQAIGLTVTTIAAIAWFGFGATWLTAALLGLLLVFALLESVARVLRRLLDVRAADARRPDPRVGVQGVRRHLVAGLTPRRRRALRCTADPETTCHAHRLQVGPPNM